MPLGFGYREEQIFESCHCISGEKEVGHRSSISGSWNFRSAGHSTWCIFIYIYKWLYYNIILCLSDTDILFFQLACPCSEKPSKFSPKNRVSLWRPKTITHGQTSDFTTRSETSRCKCVATSAHDSQLKRSKIICFFLEHLGSQELRMISFDQSLGLKLNKTVGCKMIDFVGLVFNPAGSFTT